LVLLRAIALFAIALPLAGCPIADDHAVTEITAICTHELELPFIAQGERTVGSLDIEGREYETDPDAYASLDEFTLEPITGTSDLSFIETLTLELVSDGLPTVVIAELEAPGPAVPVIGVGDPEVNLVDYLTREMSELQVTVTGQPPGGGGFLLRFQACLDTRGLRLEDRDDV
jgi:hypothetical protein